MNKVDRLQVGAIEQGVARRVSISSFADSPEISGRKRGDLRLAVVVSHAIQYFAPWHRAVAAIPGIDLKVFFCREDGAKTYFDPDFGIEVKWDIPLLEGYPFEFLPQGKSSIRSEFFQVDNPSVADELAQFHPDVVQLFGYASRTMWRARRWCNQNQVPVLLYSDSNIGSPTPFWKRLLKNLIVRRFYHGVAAALYTGDNNRAYHMHFGLSPEQLFPGALPIDKTAMLSNAGDLAEARYGIRRQHGIPEDAFVLLFCGKLHPRKSPTHVVEALSRCMQRGATNIWALMVGEGAERGRVEDAVAKHSLKNVVLAGFVNQGSIGKYYAASDLLIFPSAYEPHGLVVPEAGCFGLPAVVSDRVGAVGETDSARPGVNVLVYPWSDIERLSDCIMKLYEDRELYRSMSIAARRIAESRDVSVAAEQLAHAAQQLRETYCK